jgi:AcrR family transcriptional regulator
MAEEPKGREAVEQALVEAAADLLADAGPRGAGVREIARRAGVNHGQVHHYFGSKSALLGAAMRQLAAEHFANATERAGGGPIPPPLTLAEDDRYWQAVIRLALDGELELATTEIAEGTSVPRRALHALAELRGEDEPDLELKARVAAAVALQLGWVALEDFVFAVTDVTDDERDAVRQHIADASIELVAPELDQAAARDVVDRLRT